MVPLLDFQSPAGYGVRSVDAASDPVDVCGRQTRWLERRPPHVRPGPGYGALFTRDPPGLRRPRPVPPVSSSAGSGSSVSHTRHNFVCLSQFAHCSPAGAVVGTVALDDAGLRVRSHLRRQGRRGSFQNASRCALGAAETTWWDKHFAPGPDDLPVVVRHVRVRSEQ